MIICACGCGQLRSDRYPNGKKVKAKVKFINYHQNRGRKHTQEELIKIRKAATGRIFTESHRKNISLSHRGHKSPFWKGGRRRHESGYIMIWKPDHHNCNTRGLVFEYRLVYEEYYRCCLLKWATVHHINGIKDDNRIENLKAMSNRDHASISCRRLREQFEAMRNELLLLTTTFFVMLTHNSK